MSSLTVLLTALGLMVALLSAATADDDTEEDSSSSSESEEDEPGKEMSNDVCCKFSPPPNNKLDQGKKKEFFQCLRAKRVDRRGPPQHHEQGYRQRRHPPRNRNRMECVDECFFDVSGLLKFDNRLDEEAIRKRSMEFVSDEWTSVTKASLTKCFDKQSSGGNRNYQCNSGASQFRKCMIREAYMNCPENLWNDSEECQKEKEIMSKYPNQWPPPRQRNRHQ